MPTLFPGAVDNFTNPTPADKLSTPAVLHTDQHSNINDAVEALETWALGVGQPVAIGAPANGLSITAAQVLTIGLASAVAAGALSAADWTTFNNKVGVEVDPVFLASAAAAIPALPLSPALGGTGIANAAGSTLTLGGATTISTGGTIALGGFTLTVPATGTAALLATANVFTANQKINVNSTTALFVEQDGVNDNVFIVNTTNSAVAVGTTPTADERFKVVDGGIVATSKYVVGIHADDQNPYILGLFDDSYLTGTAIFAAFGDGTGNVTMGTINSKTLSLMTNSLARLQISGAGVATYRNSQASTNTIVQCVDYLVLVTGSGGGANGLGPLMSLSAETATNNTLQKQGAVSSYWVDATNATRKATLALSAYDTAERKGVEIRANGSAPDIALLGDTWWEGEGFGLPYGSCSSVDVGIAWTQASAVQNTWYDISDADMADGQLNLVTHDGSGQLTVTLAGRYLITYTITSEVSAANVHIETAISVSGTESTFGIGHAHFVTANAEAELSGTAILDLAANATINISIRTTDAGTPNLSVDMLDITLVQVGGT